MQGAEADVVFNVVYTPRTFRYLRWFVVSLVAHSDTRFRLVANGCGEDEVDQMRELAQRLPDQIAGVVILSDPGRWGTAAPSTSSSRAMTTVASSRSSTRT